MSLTKSRTIEIEMKFVRCKYDVNSVYFSKVRLPFVIEFLFFANISEFHINFKSLYCLK